MNREGLFMVILGDTGSPYHDLMEKEWLTWVKLT